MLTCSAGKQVLKNVLALLACEDAAAAAAAVAGAVAGAAVALAMLAAKAGVDELKSEVAPFVSSSYQQRTQQNNNEDRQWKQAQRMQGTARHGTASSCKCARNRNA